MKARPVGGLKKIKGRPRNNRGRPVEREENELAVNSQEISCEPREPTDSDAAGHGPEPVP